MDTRSWLSRDTLLRFPGMTCRIMSSVGKGSNALVYLGEYEDAGSTGQFHEVLIKELFPLHPQGAIYRDSEGRICVRPEGAALYQLHKDSFERGNRIHLDLLRQSPSMVGANVNTFQENGTLYTVMGCSGGVSFEAAMREEGLTLRRIAERMLAVLDALDVFHASGLLHLDISPDNVLLIPQGRREHVILIDYNSSATYDELQKGLTAYSSKPGFTAPEICTGDYARIGFHSDLYSVTAVFFSSLMGRPLSLEEIIRATPPDGQKSKYLAGAPDTVRYLVKRILRRGLNTVISRRYAGISAMRIDFQELLDRIDGVGVTHGALYESARKALNGFLLQNPAFAFLNRTEDLYPLRFYDAGLNALLDADAFLSACLSSGSPVLLGANGGQGKTTALLHMAARQNARYSPQKAVAVFLPAYGYRPDEKWFVHDSILRMLKFKRGTETYAAARHELDILFSRTAGTDPTALILLDGLNEVACDTRSLIQELNELAQMPGVALAVSSRSEVSGLPVRRMVMQPLADAEVAEVLARSGLLIPEDARMKQLLRTPLMLSLFIRTSLASQRQLSVTTADELMRSLLRMEVDRYAQDDPVHWQMDVAIHYVLPAIAERERALNHALTQSELLGVLTRCYRTIRARDLLRFYPQWIGHSKAILGDAKNAEEWLSVIVQDLLWRRAGMLVRDEDGDYRIFHQQVREWLFDLNRSNQSKIRRRKFWRACATLTFAAFVIAVGRPLVWEPYIRPVIEQTTAAYYPKEEAKEIIRASLEQCSLGRNVDETASPFLDHAEAGDAEYFDQYLSDTLGQLDGWKYVGGDALKQKYVRFEGSVEQGRMPWSGNDFSAEEFGELADFPTRMAAQYETLLEVLDWVMHSEKWYDRYAQAYAASFRELVQADRELINLYYAKLLKPEMDSMEGEDRDWYRELTGRYGAFETPKDPDATLDSLLDHRNALWMQLNNGPAMDRYQQEQKGKGNET